MIKHVSDNTIEHKLTNQEVYLINPGGCENYEGVVTRVFLIGNEEWADIKWELPYHPCTSPMQVIHLKEKLT